MELSESVQKGFQLLADPGAFGPGAFALVLRAAFQSLLGAQADGAVLGPPPAPRAASAGLAKVEPGLFAKRLLGQMALTLPDIQSTPRSQDRPNTSRGASTPGTLKWDALRFVPHRRLLSVDHPDLKHIDPVILKHCHAAAATCILEAGKQRADKSTLSSYLEDCKFDRERIELFCTEYQNNKNSLEILLGSIGRSLPHITDVSWRLEYQIKTNQLHKMHRPAYLVTLNTENSDSGSQPEISFSCTMEQLQDLVGKLKDALKSLERATQL
ncbi:COMM domain-containing protein 3 isoform X1 [Choloepus didactylus]|uniref:COMM domain-containing protein 3 isoform X1 n=1 Tax=Choloepus didactylus TaxID=27675 RepID=UPI0018A0C1FA|nr:COMM domain-containing protein 3 isoform X1 [Choloepus didactylus]